MNSQHRRSSLESNILVVLAAVVALALGVGTGRVWKKAASAAPQCSCEESLREARELFLGAVRAKYGEPKRNIGNRASEEPTKGVVRCKLQSAGCPDLATD